MVAAVSGGGRISARKVPQAAFIFNREGQLLITRKAIMNLRAELAASLTPTPEVCGDPAPSNMRPWIETTLTQAEANVAGGWLAPAGYRRNASSKMPNSSEPERNNSNRRLPPNC